MTKFQLLAAATLVIPATAMAQTASTEDTGAPATVEASPSAAPSEPPALCTDRPTKATSACTVPQGMFQLESDLINFTRSSDSGVKLDTILWTNPTLKYGLTSSTDIQVNIAPYETIRVHGSGFSDSVHGVGDTYVRLKQRLTAADAKAQFALVPYIKIPTAKSGIGNRKVEGGLVGTGVFSLPQGFSVTITPEIDDLENSALDGHHAQLVGAFNVSKTLSSKLTAYAELWTSQNYDPDGTVRQYSADAAFAYLASPNLQLDAGVNVGLNRATPDVQAYFGISTRF